MARRGVNKGGQVTFFVIIAIVLVVAIASYFVFKDTLFPSSVSSTFEPIKTNFLNCVKEKTLVGIKIMESKGGYIFNPEFIPGSSYMPFSSQLDFLGTGIPYWHSISENNLEINQVPEKKELQNQMQTYLDQEIPNCNFDSFVKEGYKITKGVPTSEVVIKDNLVQVFVDMDIQVTKDAETATMSTHQVEVDSELGNLYNDAISFDNKERKELFLENYSVDVLRTYAPVDGVELTCAPKIWNADEIFSTLKRATQDNFFALKNSGEKNDYFNLKIPIDSEVKVLNFQEWPSNYQVEPASSAVLVSKPVGIQQGLGILGFCYAPYHFVYSLKYPVLVQLTNNGETFQFPLAIVIDGNVAKKVSTAGEFVENSYPLCDGPFSNFTVELSSSDLRNVEGNISYDCLGSSCQIGETKGGTLEGAFPQCANGKIIVNSKGYKEKSEEISTVNGGSVSLILDKEYEKQVSLKIKNSKFNEKAVVYFSSDDDSKVFLYPEQNKIKLSAGEYNLKVYLYDNSSIKFDATTIKQCVDVPSGIGGIFGITHEECSDVAVPEQNISNVLVGGGSETFTVSESSLSSNNKLQIDVDRYNSPTSLEELQVVYTLVDSKKVEVSFI
ncbi:hypothetical protein GW931_01315 [archaeon]|nr:hypothetical protein [archaeon]PJC45237.1 MAG: hypothetical protein CO037_02575 [Candidatus Pacearchaeota archaeon CG_4_9_14_0_2_um_filter_30_8]